MTRTDTGAEQDRPASVVSLIGVDIITDRDVIDVPDQEVITEKVGEKTEEKKSENKKGNSKK